MVSLICSAKFFIIIIVVLFVSLQGSTLTFQLTSLVASDNLDVTSQKIFLLAKR